MESLQLRCSYSDIVIPDVRSIAAHLSRSWTVERPVDQDKFNAVIALENGTRLDEDEVSLQPRLYGKFGEIFRRIWPEKERGGDWREEWKSWPLSEI